MSGAARKPAKAKPQAAEGWLQFTLPEDLGVLAVDGNLDVIEARCPIHLGEVRCTCQRNFTPDKAGRSGKFAGIGRPLGMVTAWLLANESLHKQPDGSMAAMSRGQHQDLKRSLGSATGCPARCAARDLFLAWCQNDALLAQLLSFERDPTAEELAANPNGEPLLIN